MSILYGTNEELKNIKRNKLKELLKSQIIYDYVIKLSGVPMLNRRPMSHLKRIEYDNNRFSDNPSIKEAVIQTEKKQLLQILKDDIIILGGITCQMAAEYGVNANTRIFAENVAKEIQKNTYHISRKYLPKIEAAYIKQNS